MKMDVYAFGSLYYAVRLKVFFDLFIVLSGDVDRYSSTPFKTLKVRDPSQVEHAQTDYEVQGWKTIRGI